MKKFNENSIDNEHVSIEFYGWTNSNNKDYTDVYDEIHKYRKFSQPENDKDIIGIPYYDPPEKQEYVDNLQLMS